MPLKLFGFRPLPGLKRPDIDLLKMLAFEFFDAANKSIEGKKVQVQVADKTHEHKTDATGKIPVISAASAYTESFICSQSASTNKKE